MSYYRHFVLDYPSIIVPLTDLLKCFSYSLTPTSVAAFDFLKSTMLTLLVLGMPDFSQLFCVTTDASQVVVGVVLSQHHRLIASFSNKVDPRFQTASAYKREMFAISEAVQEDISMDFIIHLPPVGSKLMIWMVVDRLSKYAHFITLPSKFTAASLARCLFPSYLSPTGMPKTIVSDRDILFLSQFWRELFRLSGTTLSYNNTYHPQIDGQTEVLITGRTKVVRNIGW
ncbi:UNVERIFIED_CONTAM: Retrovirus-related Pol polyprotein from transposon [Sesamum latifolium]|uniref:Retrovirus-related Pol polyprotein from transposon n=1 Tax=Sesamum latifolium TaxID=2727402 RepID=A0AAW2WG74_9LAMI